ncbi:hypothetical protein AHAS_Ahas10G0064200 [Arachis hypogaea]
MRGGGRATPFNPKPEVEVQRIWSKNGNVKVIDLTRDFFLVHFGNEGDYKHALFEGSWQLVPAIKVLGREFKVEYESLYLICFGCGEYGHRVNSCPESRRSKKEHGEATMDGSRVPRDPPDAAMGDIVDNSKLTVPSSTQPLPNVLEQNSVV